ncbi:MAG: helix-turn-helix domain-containing protein [Treponema sp.]|jgi:AraC-like DNA-binding protein/ligand-binding sensor protein|nr:helix-turn-helix domain-containing protein [Treponema sp.]
MTKSPNLIQRRELEPLLLKAYRIVKHYEKAADCAAAVMGPDGDAGAIPFCSFKGHCQWSGCQANGEKACSLMHMDAVNKARRLGGSYIYVCPAGFIFWTSPFYSGERFAGALLSGGVLGVKKKQAVDYFMENSKDAVPRDEIEHTLSAVPEKSSEEVKALAQIMLVCADQISGTSTPRINSLNTESDPDPDSEEAEPVKENAQKTGNCAYPMELERLLLASLRRGDNGTAQKILKELLDVLHKQTEGNFSAFRLKALELVVMLSRAVSNPQDIESGHVLETNSRFMKKIGEDTSLAEVTETLSLITERMSGKIFSFSGVRHSSALRKAERVIWENYTRKISLREIASASGLSAPYFSAIFKEEMGENLSNYLNRLRVEKAAAMLVTTNVPISQIATECGFLDQSWFSKTFKHNTGFSPGKYREQGNVVQ